MIKKYGDTKKHNLSRTCLMSFFRLNYDCEFPSLAWWLFDEIWKHDELKWSLIVIQPHKIHEKASLIMGKSHFGDYNPFNYFFLLKIKIGYIKLKKN